MHIAIGMPHCQQSSVRSTGTPCFRDTRDSPAKLGTFGGLLGVVGRRGAPIKSMSLEVQTGNSKSSRKATILAGRRAYGSREEQHVIGMLEKEATYRVLAIE